MAYERERLYATFEKHDEFVAAQDYLVNLNLFDEPNQELDAKEALLLQKLNSTFNEYQEQSYLLDPFLEGLLSPVIEKIKGFAHDYCGAPERTPSGRRVERLSGLLYGYIKFRGYKTITRFFPHEIADMPIVLNFMLLQSSFVQHPSQWALRYTMMLWLSLVSMLPFDLAQFDDEAKPGHTARSLELVGKTYLGKAGLERQGAALFLSRLYMRKDMKYVFPEFVRSFRTQISTQTMDVITAIGHLQIINEVIKTGSADQIHDLVPDYLEIIHCVNEAPTLVGNTILRKMRAKLIPRMAIRMLPVPKVRKRGRILGDSSYSTGDDSAVGEHEIPEIVESLLQHLFDNLQDKDTIVRWSAAKGVARIAERLPQNLTSQILETVMDMFKIHSIAAASLYDLPAIAESTWHGATLACAEMARRSLVGPDQLPILLEWISKALYFDLRKGSHSIGSNVRDAAAYVLWSLARTQNVASLLPHANDLARQLVTVALFDREIHIRRAASAAFQEHVGRAGLLPHGIDVLRKTDFYAISGKRNAFLVAAPQVAEHSEYRPHLIDHLLNVVLRHWDTGMRELGSQSLRAICELDLLELGPRVTHRAVGLLQSFDIGDVQGGLLVLSEISLAYQKVGEPEKRERLLREIFSHLSSVKKDVIFGPRNGIVTAAACQLIGNAITLTEIKLKEQSSVPNWRQIIDHGLRYRLEAVQETAAAAYATISKREDFSDDIKKLIKDLKSAFPVVQQSLPRVLGRIDYNKCQKGLSLALGYLLDQTKVSSKAVIEVRRNSYQALPQILHTLSHNLVDRLSPYMVQSILDNLLSGLNDYTIDERGDVGSWVRIACVQGLTSCIGDLFAVAASVENFEEYLPLPKYHHAVAGILKQGVERLDNVRQEVGACFARLLKLPPVKSGGYTWSLPGLPLLEEIFSKVDTHQARFPWLAGEPGESPELPDWADGTWLFPRAVRLLDIPEYRPFVLKGYLLSMGCKTESTQRPAAASMSKYAKSLPISDDYGYTLIGLVTDVIGVAKVNLASNAVVIPVLQTLTILLEADALRSLADHPEGVESLSTVLDLATRNIGRFKSIQRIQESMKITINLIAIQAVSKRAISRLPDFLVHPYPRVRADTAEYLYLFLQGADALDVEEVAESALLETEWSSDNVETAKNASSSVVESLLASIS